MRATKILYREFWGEAKRTELISSMDRGSDTLDAAYSILRTTAENRFSLRRCYKEGDYSSWISVRDLSAQDPNSGLQEMRRNRLISSDRNALLSAMEAYTNKNIPFPDLVAHNIGPVEPAGRFDPVVARRRILAAGRSAISIKKYAYQPFDNRWCAWTSIRPIWNEPRPELARHAMGSTPVFITRMIAERPHEQFPALTTQALPDYHLLRPNVVAFPFMLETEQSFSEGDLLAATTNPGQRCNLSKGIQRHLTSLGIREPATNPAVAKLIWSHCLAICFTPAYLASHGPDIRQGWPRIPLPSSAALLRTSAALGEKLAALLDPDTPVPGVTQGTVDRALAAIGIPSTAQGTARDWHLTGWGTRTAKGITMPGRGRTDLRAYAPTEAATAAHAALLGAQTRDVWMNGTSFWKNIPDAVWNAHIGGYQVLKKWLSYRDGSILKRPLTPEEVAHVQGTARRLAAILLMGPDLDASFRACAAAHVPLPAPNPQPTLEFL